MRIVWVEFMKRISLFCMQVQRFKVNFGKRPFMLRWAWIRAELGSNGSGQNIRTIAHDMFNGMHIKTYKIYTHKHYPKLFKRS